MIIHDSGRRNTCVSDAAAFRGVALSPDGRLLLYSGYATSSGGVGSLDLAVLSPDSVAGPVPFARTGFDEREGRFSPDGRWVAYVSNESGLNEIYVRQVADDLGGGSAAAGGGVDPFEAYMP